MKITIIGTGFVGLTSAVVYASFGHEICGIDIDQRKIDLLNQGVVTFYEPKLTEMVQDELERGKLSFTTDYKEGVSGAKIVMVCVGTPSREDGSVDTAYIEASLREMAKYITDGTIVVIKSTVPPGTLDLADQILKSETKAKYSLASLPEFLKEGTAVDDTLYPDRTVIGADDDETMEVLAELHKPLKAPIVKISPRSAQLAKYAANNYLASRIVFVNEIANVCEKAGANIDEVVEAIGYEKRIGKHYWYPGLGYGGSCFPKDVKGLANIADGLGLEGNLFAKLDELNSERPVQIFERIKKEIEGGWQGKKVAMLGLSFKPGTDDQRVAPALIVAPYLLAEGASIISYDPMVKRIADEKIAESLRYNQVETIEEAVADADVIIALIEWSQIVGFNFKATKVKEKQQVFIDARNQFDKAELTKAGYQYFGIGK